MKSEVNAVEKLRITGGKPLKGEVTICGAKNAAICILPAVLLIDGWCRIENLPNISDVKKYIDVLAIIYEYRYTDIYEMLSKFCFDDYGAEKLKEEFISSFL